MSLLLLKYEKSTDNKCIIKYGVQYGNRGQKKQGHKVQGQDEQLHPPPPALMG